MRSYVYADGLLRLVAVIVVLLNCIVAGPAHADPHPPCLPNRGEQCPQSINVKMFRSSICGRFLKSLAMLGAFCLSGHAYCSSADTVGLEVKAGDFSVEIYYSTISKNGDDIGPLMRDPAQMLFSVASFVQGNYDELKSSGKRIRVDVLQKEDLHSEDLAILEEVEIKGGKPKVHKFTAETDLFEKVAEYICTRVISRCRLAPSGDLLLYVCGTSSCPGEVHFGSGLWVDPPRYSLMPRRRGVKKIHVTRGNVHELYPPFE